MRSDLQEQARRTIETIMAELDPDRLKQRFDDPIAQALREFDYVAACPISHQEFHRIVAAFVETLYGRAFGALWLPEDPLAEAITILEHTYQSAVHDIGYDAAVMDANEPAEGGIQTVLTGLAESIRDLERQKHAQAVFARHLYGDSWALRCQIARILSAEYGAFWPPRLARCTPEQLVDYIPVLMSKCLDCEVILRQVIS